MEVYNLDGTKVYKNDLWLCVSGEKRGSLSAKEVYKLYKKDSILSIFLNTAAAVIFQSGVQQIIKVEFSKNLLFNQLL